MSVGDGELAPPPEPVRWVKVARLGEIPLSSARRVEVAGRGVALFRLGERDVKAIDDGCPHAGFSLSQGDVRDRQVRCVLHAWTFSLDDGRCTFGARDVHAWAVRLDEDEIFVAVPERDDAERKAVLEGMTRAVATGDVAALDGWVDRALAAEVPVSEVLALARAASMAEGLAAQTALGDALGLLPGLSRGDVLITALSWAARPAPSTPPVVEPPASPARLASRGLGARHQRRRLIATLEQHAAAAAFEVALAYLADGHNPLWLAQDLVRRALEVGPAAVLAAVQAARTAYGWPQDPAPLARALAVVAYFDGSATTKA